MNIFFAYNVFGFGFHFTFTFWPSEKPLVLSLFRHVVVRSLLSATLHEWA